LGKDEIIIGPAVITLLNPDHLMDGETVKGFKSTGSGPLFQVMALPDAKLKLIDAKWATGERDVRATEATGPKAIRGLDSGRLRLSVSSLIGGRLWLELSQARVNPQTSDSHSNLFQASLKELDEGAGLSVLTILESYGVEVDTRRKLSIPGKHRDGYYCAVFDPSQKELPIIAFVLTRVLPLINEYSGSQGSLF
jgi:hypothetical protein